MTVGLRYADRYGMAFFVTNTQHMKMQRDTSQHVKWLDEMFTRSRTWKAVRKDPPTSPLRHQQLECQSPNSQQAP